MSEVGGDRRLEAAVALLMWACGVELLPLGHLALHATLEPHTHGVHDDGVRDRGVHHHGAVEHTHEDVDATEEGWGPWSEGSHGAHSLAHRELVLRPDVASLPPVRPPRLGLAPPLLTPTALRETRLPARARARSPPRSAFAV